MADGYTRQRSSEIVNNNVIDANDFDAEFNAIADALNASSGHTHDGTTGGGAPIEKVGPSQELIVSATKVEAKTTNTLDLGSSGVQFKDGFFDGTLNTDVLSVDETSTFTGAVTASSTLAVTGASTFTGTVTANGDVAISGDLGVDSDFDVNTDKFTVNALTGDTAVAGTLAVAGATGVDGNFDVATNKFTVASATGNTAVAGTLAVTGTSSFTGAITASGGVTGDLIGNADTATGLESAISITLTGDVTGSVTNIDGTDNISITTVIENNSNQLGVDTTGDYVESLVAGTGVSITENNGEGATPTIAIGQAVSTTSDVTFNDVVVSGNLTVSGTTTYVDTTHLNVSDNQIILNYDVTGTPTENAGIEVERGTAANKTLIWNETSDKWTVGSETFVAGTFEGNLTGNVTGNANTATTAGTVTTAAQPNITSLGTLTTLTVDDITINGSTISDSGDLTLDVGGDIILDANGGDFILKDNGDTQGRISVVNAVNSPDTVSFYAGTTERFRIKPTATTSVGNFNAQGNISASGNVSAGGTLTSIGNATVLGDMSVNDDIIMTAGASDWKFEVGASNELTVYYGSTKLFKLDSSGNLTVKGNVTAYGTP